MKRRPRSTARPGRCFPSSRAIPSIGPWPQTLHRITLQLTGTVRVVLPGRSYSVTVLTQAPVAENVIVGDVPEAYTNVANTDDLLNLIPENK